MKRLYDEIINAKESILDSKRYVSDDFLPKWILYLKNLMLWVEERLNRWDIGDPSVRLREVSLMEQLVKDLEKDYYY